MGSTDSTAANIKRPRHSGVGRNPAGQPEGLGPRVREDDAFEKQAPRPPLPLGEGRGEGLHDKSKCVRRLL